MVYGPSYEIGSPEEASQASFSSSLFVALTSGKDKPVPDTWATSYVDVSLLFLSLSARLIIGP